MSKYEGTFRRGDIVSGVLVDLPGTYSLSAFTPEEVIARDYLLSGEADAVINVVDATNLERNLYLTSQLLELEHRRSSWPSTSATARDRRASASTTSA